MQGNRSSQTLVCQLSSVSFGGIQGGRDTRIRSASALTNGSYVARSSANFCSLAVPSFKEKPAATSLSRTCVHSAVDNRFTPGVGGVQQAQFLEVRALVIAPQ